MASGLKAAIILATVALVIGHSAAFAQSTPADATKTQTPTGEGNASQKMPEVAAQPQPQGHPGPTDTKSGGAPAASPQGDAPSGMQPPVPGTTVTEPPKK